jgi:isorenieratene synthase
MSSIPHTLLLPADGGTEHAEPGHHVVVVGGGIAGVAAATVLAERGVRVTLVERERFLGGRAAAWTERLASGESFEMERGFHAFFRQYYNLRALLRRIDPGLEFLQPLADYPILGPKGQVQSFAGLPRKTPQNVISLTLRTHTMGWRDLLRVNKRHALEMLTFEMQRCYARWDRESAAHYLDSLRFPPQARRLLFDVFSHSFFNPEEEMSAAELLMMFHFYFTGNPEGLLFDVAQRPFSLSIWDPFARYLTQRGVMLRLGEAACEVQRRSESGWRVATLDDTLDADAVVLALTVPAVQKLVERSNDLDDPAWRKSVARLQLTRPFAVWRLWLDGPTRPERAPFAGTTGSGILDNISLYHLFEDESRDWAARHGGAVVELHAYAVDPATTEEEMRADMLQALHQLYPETASHRTVDERFLLRQDCPAFQLGSWESRPGVQTPLDGVTLAGDFVRLPIPSALMERATASGFLASNVLLSRIGVRPEPILAIQGRGVLASMAWLAASRTRSKPEASPAAPTRGFAVSENRATDE